MEGVHYDEDFHENLINYQLHLPFQYEDSDKQWPLILFLHGSGRRGEDIRLLDNYGLNRIAASNNDFSFIVLSPQCPNDSKWPKESDRVIFLLNYIMNSYRVDPTRVYVTGFSLGGHGAWDLAARYPEKFAAVVPIAELFSWFLTQKKSTK